MNTARLLALCFVLLLALPAGAQTTGSLFGSVTDQTGAMVPGAKIQAVNPATGEVRTTESNQSGAYSLPALPVGLWNLRCEMGGFKSWVQEGIELTVNRNARADVRLEIGAIAQETVVVEDAPMVETSSSQVSALVDQRRVVELPINTRNTLSLVSLIPGAQGNSRPATPGIRRKQRLPSTARARRTATGRSTAATTPPPCATTGTPCRTRTPCRNSAW